MNNKTVNIGLVGLIILIFFTYFVTFNFLFHKDITQNFELLEVYTLEKDWNKVLEVSENIKSNWDDKKTFFMLNYGEAEFSVFENHINYIIGGATSKDFNSVLSNTLAAKDLWTNIKKIVPEP